MCTTEETIFAPSFTGNERKQGCKLRWYLPCTLRELMQGHHTDHHKEQFKMLRDLVFVEEFLRMKAI